MVLCAIGKRGQVRGSASKRSVCIFRSRTWISGEYWNDGILHSLVHGQSKGRAASETFARGAVNSKKINYPIIIFDF